MAYEYIYKAWFTQKIIVWWIKRVFWPHHLKIHGNVYASLIFDNFSSHKHLDNSDVATKFGLQDKWCIFLSANLTSCIQPADMGIIAVLRVRYKLFMVRRLLAVYEDQCFTDIDTARKGQKIGCKVLTFVGKSHVLDAAEILNQIWSLNEKYSKITSIKIAGKYGILKYSCSYVSTSETDADIVGGASFEEEYALKLYMNDLVESLAYFKTMLSERKD